MIKLASFKISNPDSEGLQVINGLIFLKECLILGVLTRNGQNPDSDPAQSKFSGLKNVNFRFYWWKPEMTNFDSMV